MNRSLILSVFSVVVASSIGAVATASTVNVSLDLYYSDSNADLLVDTSARGAWQLYATADEEGLTALATQLTGIAGLDAVTNRPWFQANSDITPAPPFDSFKETFLGGTKPWDTDTDTNSATLEMLFAQVPVASPGPQELTYDVGKAGGTTPNVDELGDSVFLSVLGVSMTDGVLLAFGSFGAGSSVVVDPSTAANIFLGEGTATDPPAVGDIAAAGTLNIQTRTNIGVRAGDINLDGLVNALDAGEMFTNWDGGASSSWTWQDGDLNGDLSINAIDAGAMFASWTGDSGPSVAAAGVPEPSTLMLASFGLLSMGCRRRKRA